MRRSVGSSNSRRGPRSTRRALAGQGRPAARRSTRRRSRARAPRPRARARVERDPAEAAIGDRDEQRADRRVDEVVGDVEEPAGRGASRNERSSSVETVIGDPLSAQAAHAGRRGLARGGFGRAERGRDVGVARGRTRSGVRRRRARSAVAPARSSSSAYAGRPSVATCSSSGSGRGRRAGARRRDAGGDGEHPGAQLPRVTEVAVPAQRAQEGLLECVLGRLCAEAPARNARMTSRCSR